MAITTPALRSIENRFLPHDALKAADRQLVSEGINPVDAFSDEEINRHHRAIAIGWLASLPDFARSCLYRNPTQFEYITRLEHQTQGEQ